MRLLAFLLSLSAFAQPPSGHWLGELSVGAVKLRIGFTLTPSSAGELAAKVDSLDQGASIPVKSVTFTGGLLRIDMGIARYEGTLAPDRSRIEGTFTQGGLPFPLLLKPVDRFPETVRPQNPRRPFPYQEKEVAFESGAVHLAGTLTYPKGDGPFPAAVLLTGSGPQDRDETLMGHKPFLVLSDHLTRQGFAVLRLDDRGVGKSTGDLPAATLEDLAGDALAAVAFLATQPIVNPRRIGLIGHSEGGIVAPLAASRSHDVAFVVMLAGSGVRGDLLLREQGIALLRAMKAPQAAIDQQVRTQAAMFDAIRGEPDNAAAEKKLRAVLPAGAQAEQQIKMITTPSMRYFLNYDPAPALQKVRCPILALNGSLDVQVPAAQNLPAIAAALAQGQATDYTVVSLPRLNHLLQTASTGAPNEYAAITETIAPSALNLISGWLIAHQ